MRCLVTYKKQQQWAAGVNIDDVVIDLQEAAWQGGKPTTIKQIITANEVDQAIEHAVQALSAGHVPQYPVGSLELGPVITDPEKILCVGANYRAHLEEADYPAPAFPEVFGKYANTLIGPRAEIPLTSASEQVDYEGELAVIIGKRGKNIPYDQALEHVAGYAVANDISARDIQLRVSQWIVGKSMDGFLPIGPGLIPAASIPNPYGLRIQTRLNGKVMQDSTTDLLIFNIHHIISFLSNYLTLEPGDIICTGTPGGVGLYCDPPVFLQNGDEISVEIEGIGTIRNKAIRID